jgi:hypothetical protein
MSPLVALIVLALVLAVLCWIVTKLPVPAPWGSIVIGLMVIVWVVAALSTLFGIDLLGAMRHVGR